ncbi:MAG: maleylpyruvate isomerase N-terminal domain-containing protein [Thermomicrobiales bacterium]
MNAPDVLKYGHLTVLGTVDCLAGPDWERPGACGRWSVKEIVAHVASYELVLVDILTSQVDGGPTPLLDDFLAAPAEFNDRQVDQRSVQTAEMTLAEYRDAAERAMALAARIPAEMWRQPGILPWYGAEYDLDDLTTYMYYGHKREHTAQIALFRDRVPYIPDRAVPT